MEIAEIVRELARLARMRQMVKVSLLSDVAKERAYAEIDAQVARLDAAMRPESPSPAGKVGKG